ncbi:hypothetical protein BKA64DRAFT_760902 [Cadophora sp. MPI-SDFR-AT-0126]|nr:hypothetical protein BKA64DRAFT_760902 [Leotiomycetes sp. MPI-SDFR-AT-0126]
MSQRKIKIDLKPLVARCLLHQSKLNVGQSADKQPIGGNEHKTSENCRGRGTEDLGVGFEKLDITPANRVQKSAIKRGDFEKYPKLPFELRLKVIKDSISRASSTDSPRVIEILYYDISKGIDSDGWPYHKSNHKHKIYSKNPTLHKVSKEFHKEALKTWSVRIDTPHGDCYARLDPDNTIIYISYTELDDDSDPLDMYSDMLSAEICSKTKHLAIDFEMWNCHETVNPLQKFTALETFTFVVHDAACCADWEPGKQPVEFEIVQVDEDDLEQVRPGICLWDDINHLVDLCKKYKVKNPEYKAPTVKTAIMYCDDSACCNSVESVENHLVDVLAPGGGRPRP